MMVLRTRSESKNNSTCALDPVECMELGRLPNSSSSSGVRLTCAVRSGKVRQEIVDVKVNEVVVGNGLKVTVKERQEQGRVKHEKGEM